jgi:hypothetical protein
MIDEKEVLWILLAIAPCVLTLLSGAMALMSRHTEGLRTDSGAERRR